MTALRSARTVATCVAAERQPKHRGWLELRSEARRRGCSGRARAVEEVTAVECVQVPSLSQASSSTSLRVVTCGAHARRAALSAPPGAKRAAQRARARASTNSTYSDSAAVKTGMPAQHARRQGRACGAWFALRAAAAGAQAREAARQQTWEEASALNSEFQSPE